LETSRLIATVREHIFYLSLSLDTEETVIASICDQQLVREVDTFEVLVHTDSNVVRLLLFFPASDVNVNGGYPARRESPAGRLPSTKRLEAY
jgi:hypothetical protein